MESAAPSSRAILFCCGSGLHATMPVDQLAVNEAQREAHFGDLHHHRIKGALCKCS